MSGKNKKQFGVWMDSHRATIIGRKNNESGEFAVLGKAEAASRDNSNENAANNAEKASLQKFYKEIASHMQNIDELHVTGTGTAQEQFINYMADTAQFKNVVAKESTSNKMSDEKLIEYIAAKFN